MLILDIIADTETYNVCKNKNGILALGKFYQPKLIKADSVQLKMNSALGGIVQLNHGDIGLMLDLFSNNNQWPPPYKITITGKYLLPDDTATTVFQADGLLKGFNDTEAIYKIYDTENTTQILDAAPDFDGATGRYYPLAVGVITCKIPLRIGTTLEYRYHKAGLAGTTKHVDYHVYDNGVDICDNVTDNGTDFTLSVTPVGEVRISGTGTIETLDDLIDFACGVTKLNLTADKTYSASPSPDLSIWIDQQDSIIPILSDVSTGFSHLFYISGSTLYLVSMFSDNGTVTLTPTGKKYYKSGYTYNNPIADITANWATIEIGVDGDGYPTYNTNDHSRKIKLSGYGISKSVTINSVNINDVHAALYNLAVTYYRPSAQLQMPPEYAANVNPGTLINYTDSRMPSDTDVSIRTRAIKYNYDNNEIIINGEGAIFSIPGIPTTSVYLKQQAVELKGYLTRLDELEALADGKAVIFYQSTAPADIDSSYGDYWIDKDNNKTYRYHNASSKDSTPPLVWDAVQDLDIAQSLSDADYALATADGKIQTYKQATAPTAAEYYQEGEPAGSDNEYWVKTSTQRLYKKVSGTWSYAPKLDERAKIGDYWIYESSGQVYNEYMFDTAYTEADTGSPAYDTHWKDVPDLRLFQFKTYATVSTDPLVGEYATIAEAITALAAGGTIFIKNGTYVETVEHTLGAFDYEFIGETYGKVIIQKSQNESSLFTFDSAGIYKMSNLIIEEGSGATSNYDALIYSNSSSAKTIQLNNIDLTADQGRNLWIQYNVKLIINEANIINTSTSSTVAAVKIGSATANYFIGYLHNINIQTISLGIVMSDSEGAVSRYAKKIIINDCVIEGVEIIGVKLDAVNDIDFSNNKIYFDDSGSAVINRYGVEIEAKVGVIKENIIEFNENSWSGTGFIIGIYVYALGGGDYQNITTDNNTIYIKTTTTATGGSCSIYGILDNTGNKSGISQNMIDIEVTESGTIVPYLDAIRLLNFDKSIVSKNNITVTKLTNSRGIVLISSCQNNRVVDNIIEATTGISDFGSGNTTTPNTIL